MIEIACGLGLALNHDFQYEREVGICEISVPINKDWEIKLHHDSNLDNGLRRDDQDRQIIYVIKKFK